MIGPMLHATGRIISNQCISLWINTKNIKILYCRQKTHTYTQFLISAYQEMSIKPISKFQPNTNEWSYVKNKSKNAKNSPITMLTFKCD